jgi:hypothetical protein
MDAAQLTAWRDTLLKARANPRQSVTSPDGSSVTFKGDADLERALRDVERRLNATSGRRVGVVYFQTSKGV